MTSIRLQDGKPIVHNGKVGADENCCCQSPCLCGSNFSTPPAGCDIDYIGFQVSFTTTVCGGQNITQSFQLSEANGYFESFYPLGANGCDYTILAQVFCFGGIYILEISINADGLNDICDQPGNFIGISFFLPFTMSDESAATCCPVSTDSYSYDGTADAVISGNCQGATISVTPVTIVKL